MLSTQTLSKRNPPSPAPALSQSTAPERAVRDYNFVVTYNRCLPLSTQSANSESRKNDDAPPEPIQTFGHPA